MNLLEIKNLTKAFDGLKAVNNLSMEIVRGTITCLIGPNGAGKTTVFNIISGLIKSNEGNIKYNGKDISRWDPHRIAELGITRTFQNMRLFPQMSVSDNMMITMNSKKHESLLAALLHPNKINEIEKSNKTRLVALFLNTPLEGKGNALAEELSHGQRKLLELHRAIATNADLLLLDEPTAGVFPETKKEILSIIKNLKQSGKTILFIEHDMSVVNEISDKIIVMNYGEKIAEGKPEEIMKNKEVIKAYLGEDDENK